MKLNLLLFICFISSISMFSQVDVNVEANGELYISKATFVYVSNGGDFNVDASGDAIMDSDVDEFSNLFVDGMASGTSEYRLWAPNAATARDLLSAPVSGEVFSAFATRNAAVLPAGTITGGAVMFGPFDNTTSSYVEWPAASSNTIDAGIGYRTARTTAGTLQFRGDVVVSNVNANVTLFGGGGFFAYGNLVGNPYTTYLSGSDLVAELMSSNAIDTRYISAYGWNGTAIGSLNGTDGETWTLVNNATITANGSDILIAPGQGFFVIDDLDGVDEMITFTPSMRRVSRTGDGFLPTGFSSKVQTNLDASFKIRLDDINNTTFYHSDMYFFDNNVSRDLDPSWDSGKYSIAGVGIASILVQGATDLPLRIQSLPSDDILNVSNDLVVPLQVHAQAGRSYTISLDDINLPSGSEIYLHDTLNDSFTLLNNDTYTFAPASNLTGIGRFYLRTSNSSTLGIDDVNFNNLTIKSLNGRKTIKVLGLLPSDSQLAIYDITGRLVSTHELANQFGTNSEHTIDVSPLSTGPYVVTLTDKEGRSKEAKLIIN